MALLACGVLGAGERVRTVSPGALGEEAEAASACPTFSWTAASGADGYELALFRVEGDRPPEPLYTSLVEGSATSWSPSRADCLAAGGSYAWSVRPLAEGGSPEVEWTAAEWAEPRWFRVPGAPSDDEVAAALAVLERWQVARDAEAETSNQDGSPSAPSSRPPGSTTRSAATGGSTADRKSVATGVAAVRGELPDPTGSAFGLLGISHSTDGAGVAARNEAAGADLVLDGEADGATDTRLDQQALDRSSAAAETFDVRNSGGGGMTLQVDGVDVVTTATDQDTLAALACAPGEIAKLAPGGWQCAADEDTLGSLACGAGLIAKVDAAGNWQCAPDSDSLAALGCPDGEIAKRVGGVWSCAPDDTGTAGIWSTYPEGSDVRVFNAEGNRVAIGNREMRPVTSQPTEDGALTVSHRAALPLTTQYNLTMDGKGIQTRTQAGLLDPQVDAPLLLNRFGGGVAIGKQTGPTRSALELQGSVGNTMALLQRTAGGQGMALVGDWPGLYANTYFDNGPKTMTGSGYSQIINFDQADGAISFMASTAANTTSDAPPATLRERLRLRGDGALLSSLTLNQFNLAPIAVISATYQFTSDGGSGLVVSTIKQLVWAETPVSVWVETFGANAVVLHVSIPSSGYAELVPVLGICAGIWGAESPGVYSESPGNLIIAVFDPSNPSYVGLTWDVQILIYGLL